MARLVTKFKYLKHAGRYAKYIATREGVEKLDDSKKISSGDGEAENAGSENFKRLSGQ